jgi:hypothetical protein
MLLNGYRKEVVRPECRPEAQSLHCIAHLDDDIAAAIPYLNATLGGFQYTREPPSVSFRIHGKLIAVHPRKIAVNALRDEEEMDKILEWIKSEVNEAWERRAGFCPKPIAGSAVNPRAWYLPPTRPKAARDRRTAQRSASPTAASCRSIWEGFNSIYNSTLSHFNMALRSLTASPSRPPPSMLLN